MSQRGIVHREVTAGSPVQWSDTLSRRIRIDDLSTLGTSSQTLAESAIQQGRWEIAAELTEYFLDEMRRINEALFTWLTVILADRMQRAGGPSDDEAIRVVDAIRGFGPSDGDLTAVLTACAHQDATTAKGRLELMRVRMAAIHDQLVWWIQHLLADLAAQHGEVAVRDVIVRTYDNLWKVRYASWYSMTPLERLQISVEGMRGHLSGPRHRGDVGVLDEGDRYTMVLDPCGSCGVLRRGDSDSGRPACNPAGTTHRHDWAWNRLGVGWYAVHSPIVMEWLLMRTGEPPLRPLEGCDQDGPCRWFIYKDPRQTRPEHYRGMGFQAPDQ